MAAYDGDLADAFSGLKVSSSRKPLPTHFIKSFNPLGVSDPHHGSSTAHITHRYHGQYLQAHQPVQQYCCQSFRDFIQSSGPQNSDIMDWERTYNPYHPFQNYLLYPPQAPPRRPSKPKYSAENPSPYWLEQAPFYEGPTRSDPYAQPKEFPVPSRIEVAYNTASYLLSSIFSPILITFATTIAILIAIIKLTIYWVFVAPWEAWRSFCEEVGFFGFVAFGIALCVVPFLPSFGRTLVEVAKEPEPLYILFIAGRDAIVQGPVVTSGQF